MNTKPKRKYTKRKNSDASVNELADIILKEENEVKPQRIDMGSEEVEEETDIDWESFEPADENGSREDEGPLEPVDDELLETIDNDDDDITETVEFVSMESDRIHLDVGAYKNNPFIVKRSMNEVYDIIGSIFGFSDGDYYVCSENTQTSIDSITKERRRYKCMMIRDKKNFLYTLWFDISNIGFLY